MYYIWRSYRPYLNKSLCFKIKYQDSVIICYFNRIPSCLRNIFSFVENMRAQLNPEKVKKMKSAGPSVAKKDVTVLRKPVELSCSTMDSIVSLLNDGTEEVRIDVVIIDRVFECTTRVTSDLFS